MKGFFTFFLVFSIFFAGCTTTQQTTQQPVQENGTLSVSLSSQESYNNATDVSEIRVGFESIKAITASGEELDLTVNKKIYNILEVEGEKEGLGSTELEEEAFTGLRLTVSKIELLFSNGETVEVELPQKEFVIENNFGVTTNSESNVVVYFDLYSIFLEDGKYVFTPSMVKLFGKTQFEEFMEKLEEEEEKVEEELEKPKIEQLVFEPSVGVSGTVLKVSWNVSSSEDKVVEHTAVHWDLVGGHEENFEEYDNVTEVLNGTTNDQFSTELTLPEVSEQTTLFFRVHAMVEGENTYSEEKSITITTVTEEPEEEVSVKEFTIISDDLKFDPANIIVLPGELVRITFSVPTTHVSWGGEDIRSDYFNTETIPPGASKTVEFSAPNESFKVRSYWPGTNNFKAAMDVTIERTTQ